jgi:hypothetical protein
VCSSRYKVSSLLELTFHQLLHLSDIVPERTDLGDDFRRRLCCPLAESHHDDHNKCNA